MYADGLKQALRRGVYGDVMGMGTGTDGAGMGRNSWVWGEQVVPVQLSGVR